MERLAKIFCLLLICVGFWGCNENTVLNTGEAERTTVSEGIEKDSQKQTEKLALWDGIQTSDKIRYARKFKFTILSEAGIIEPEDDLLIHLYTIDKGEDMILCYDPNCRHSYEEDENSNPRCMASVYRTMGNSVGYYEGAIYFFTNISEDAHRIYKMDTNSAVRELVAELPHLADTDYVMTFCGDKLYYTVDILHRDKITGRGSYTYRLIEVNLLDGTYRFITEESDIIVDMADPAGNTLYTRKRSDEGVPYVVAIDLETLDEMTITSAEEWSAGGVRYAVFCDEDSYYYWDSVTSDFGIKNIDGTVEKILLRGPVGEPYSATPSNKGMFYRRYFEYEGIQPGCFFMDLETGEITDLTAVDAKYNLSGYDGYYDAFIGMELEEDGKRVINYTMWSREYILNEAKQK